ncbi:MAG: hypothetical protein GY757_03730, partial [bacterium]|nr:hypothetical protein [bacterium]
TAKPINLDTDLIGILQDKTHSKIIFDPIKKYNTFAAKYGCKVTPKNPFWQKDFNLNDGSTLRLHGLTSTIISDGSDNNKENKLILGEPQILLPEKADVTYLTLCHHPASWLLDEDNVNKRLNLRAKVQLFGHKHAQVIERINYNTKNDTLRIAAGAVHPERREPDWKPRYNVISLNVEGAGDSRQLKVILYPRVWNHDILGFQHDPLATNGFSIEYFIPLESRGDASTAGTGKSDSEIKEKPGESGAPGLAKTIPLTGYPPKEIELIGREKDLSEFDGLINSQNRVLLVNGLGGIG